MRNLSMLQFIKIISWIFIPWVQLPSQECSSYRYSSHHTNFDTNITYCTKKHLPGQPTWGYHMYMCLRDPPSYLLGEANMITFHPNHHKKLSFPYETQGNVLWNWFKKISISSLDKWHTLWIAHIEIVTHDVEIMASHTKMWKQLHIQSLRNQRVHLRINKN